MNRNLNTDKGLRELEAGSTHVPSTNVWGKIDKNLQNNRSRKLAWLFLCIGVIGLFAWGLNALMESKEGLSNGKDSTASFTDIKNDEISLTRITANSQIHNTESIDVSIIEKSEAIVEPLDIDRSNVLKTPRTIERGSFTAVYIAARGIKTRLFSIGMTQDSFMYCGWPVLNQMKMEADASVTQSSNKLSGKPFFMEFGGAFGLHRRKYNLSTDLANLRQETEKAWYTWGGLVGLGVYVNPSMYVSTHIRWTQQKDQFEYVQSGITRTIAQYDPQTGDQINSYTISGTLKSTGEIKRTYVDACINVGFIITPNKGSNLNWKVGLEPGLLYYFNTASNGKTVVEVNQVSRLESEHKNTRGLGFQAQLLLVKPLISGIGLTIKPYYNHFLNSNNSKTDGYSSSTFGLNIGLRKPF